MEWIDDLNRAMGYIEENLRGGIDIGEVALQHRILTEWLPSSGYEWASKSDVELYFGPNMTAEDYKSQVWLPIEKRHV
ncbi:hypothetical protein [Adlercreutzia sp. ZJ304]|uniref:GyrI-like domain-containing protein n=1 Tax=Adlercreutzia sp. ZJ304 TaxID=2709791 RepID=UPI0013EDBEE0|nr:hypothetical protein [Adlercreutzia sp. ZJ304]